MKRGVALLLLLMVSGCGSNRSGAGDGGGTPTPDPTGTETPTPSNGLDGIWEVSGADALGAYSGEVELRPGGVFNRVVRYADPVKVEGGRELWWVWQGTWTHAGDAVTVTVPLQRADFVVKRDALERTPTDATPLTVTGAFTKSDATVSGTFSATGIAATESWKNPRALAATPIFAVDRTLVPSHPAPSASHKSTAFSLYASFHEMPWVAPYVSDARFQAAIHGFYVDRTDFDFYRATPGALRVVNKVVDPISLMETLSRADAFRWTLAAKADYFDTELATEMIDPIAKMVPSDYVDGTAWPSGDAALWTGTWVAAQAFRWEVTGEPDARANVATSIDAILRLQEITGDPATFARALRPATGNPTGSWRAGTGPNAHLEWLEGGNNDMYKGLLYGYLTAYRVLCDGGATGYESICARIRTNSGRLADDVTVAQSGLNELSSKWLAAYVTGDVGRRISAESAWNEHQFSVSIGNAMFYDQGIADWSGTHLNSTQFTALALLNEELPLASGGAAAVIEQGANTAWEEIRDQRLAMWNLVGSAVGTAPDPALQDALWRLREIPCPKTRTEIDHRIDVAEFVMSPYPALPWKNDWTTDEGRAQSLNGYPLFEGTLSDYVWKDNPMHFRASTSWTRRPGTDFSHAYWFGRRFGLIGSAE